MYLMLACALPAHAASWALREAERRGAFGADSRVHSEVVLHEAGGADERVYLVANGVRLVAGGDGRVLRVADDVPDTPFRSLRLDGDAWGFVTLGGQVFASDTFTGPLRALGALPCHTLPVRGSRGRLVAQSPDARFWSTDGRTPISPIATPPDTLLVVFTNHRVGAALTADGAVHLTDDGGVRWRRIDAPVTVAIVNESRGLSLDTIDGPRHLGADGRLSPLGDGIQRAEADRPAPDVGVAAALVWRTFAVVATPHRLCEAAPRGVNETGGQGGWCPQRFLPFRVARLACSQRAGGGEEVRARLAAWIAAHGLATADGDHDPAGWRVDVFGHQSSLARWTTPSLRMANSPDDVVWSRRLRDGRTFQRQGWRVSPGPATLARDYVFEQERVLDAAGEATPPTAHLHRGDFARHWVTLPDGRAGPAFMDDLARLEMHPVAAPAERVTIDLAEASRRGEVRLCAGESDADAVRIEGSPVLRPIRRRCGDSCSGDEPGDRAVFEWTPRSLCLRLAWRHVPRLGPDGRDDGLPHYAAMLSDGQALVGADGGAVMTCVPAGVER